MPKISCCVAIALLLAAPARAKPVWYTGFELGASAKGGQSAVLGELSNYVLAARPSGACRDSPATTCAEPGDCAAGDVCQLPYAIASSAPAYPGNTFSLDIDAAPAATVAFKTVHFPATRDVMVCFDFLHYGHCAADPGVVCTSDAQCDGSLGACRSPLNGRVAFAFDSAPGVRQCLGSIGCQGSLSCTAGGHAVANGQRVRLYFNDPAQYECGGSRVDGKHCQACGGRCTRDTEVKCTTHATCMRAGVGTCYPVDQCPDRATCGAEPGDTSFCALAASVTSDKIAYGEWTHLCLRNTRTAEQEVQCGLYRDRRGLGGAPRRQGQCAGGERDGAPCAATAECAGGGTCNAITAAAADVSTFSFGVLSAGPDPLRYAIDNIAVFDLAANPGDLDKALNRRWATLQLDGDAAGDLDRSGCTSAHTCLADTAGGKLSDGDATYLTAGPPPHDSGQFGVADPALGAGETVDPDAWVSLTCAAKEASAVDGDKTLRYGFADAAGANAVTASFDLDDEGTAHYIALPPFVAEAAPGGAPWTAAIDSARVAIQHAGDAAPHTGVRLTTCNVQLAYTLAPAPVADLAWLDVNGDGQRTVGYANDSRWVPSEIADTILSAVPQVENLVSCAASRRLIADFTDNAAAIANGTVANVSVACQARRGQRADLDVLVFDAGANDLGSAARAEGTCFQSWCAGDTSIKCSIDDECGDKGPCGGPNHLGACALPVGYTRRTILDVVPSRCVRGIRFGEVCAKEEACSYCSRSPSTTCPNVLIGCTEEEGVCRVGNVLGLTCQAEGLWCQPVAAGNNDRSPQCSGGYCIQRTSLEYIESEYRKAVELWQARRSDKRVKVVLAPPYLPSGVFAFGCQRDTFRALGEWVKQYAQEQGLAWIDQEAYLDARAPNRDPARGAVGSAAFLIDPIHLNSAGVTLIGQAIADCLVGKYDPAMDCRPLLAPCGGDAECPSGTTCATWPVGETKYCRG